MTGKLATIVAVDMIGYSALARADQDGALAAVARLNERAAAAAGEHGGRVFNTSADSTLLEFPSVARGVAAAVEIAGDQDPPCRVGVHLGEVSTMPNGDLLGDGVRVAAQLQTYAKPGAVLVSDNVKHALRGPLAGRLVPRGSVKIGKTNENMPVFEIASAASGVNDQIRNMRRTVVIGASVLAAIVAIVMLWPLLRPPPPARVAVLALTAPANDRDLQGLATRVSDDIETEVTAGGIGAASRADIGEGTRDQLIIRAKGLGAAFLLHGTAEHMPARLRLVLTVTRTSDRATVWSAAFEDAPAQAAQLQLHAAAVSSAVLRCGIDATRGHARKLHTDALASLMQACAAAQDGRDARDALAAALQREGHLPIARAFLALANTHAAEGAAPAERERLRAEALAQAERARRNDPTIGESYLALERLQARNAWDARENLLQQGITRAQRNAALNTEYSSLLLEVGRFTDALAYARNASTLDPLSPTRRNAVANVLLMSGDANGAREISDDLARAWPNDPSVWRTQTRIALWSGRYDDALAMLASPASEVRSVGAQLCWRDAAALMRRADAGGVRRVVACARSGDLPAGQTLMTLAAAGDLDEAFALARTRFVDEHRPGLDVLFTPATRAMRADPRFMPLMKDVGLLRYWDLGNRWPDFCAQPGLRYRCQAEAARLLRGS